MKDQLSKFFLKLLIVSIPLIVYYIGYNSYLLYAGKFESDAASIIKTVKKSKEKLKVKKIVFGDSVGGQLYPASKNYDSIGLFSLTTSDPSSLAGIYVLLTNILSKNQPKNLTFYYVVHPASLNNELDGKYTYNHFIKPFYKLEFYQHFSPSTHEAVRKIPYWYAAQLPFIKISDWQPEVLESTSKKKERRLSQVYIEYLKLIDEDSKKRGYRFKIVSPVLRESLKKSDYVFLQKQISENQLSEIFGGYFEEMKYIPDSLFHEKSNHYLNTTIANMNANPLNL
jgi:hypothetical protein